MIIGMHDYEKIDAQIAERRKDAAFMKRLAVIHERERALFEYLAKR